MINLSSIFLDRLRQIGFVERAAGRPALVLERLARGGGATNWYYCPDAGAISAAAEMWRPGSELRFVFDGRLGPLCWSKDLVEQVLDLAARDGEALLGVLSGDGLSIRMSIVSELADIDVADIDAFVFFGEFPPLSDGDNVLSVVLPDADGILRRHPH